MIKTKVISLVGICLSALVAACSDTTPSSPVEYPEMESEGAQLLVQRCSTCHAAPKPSLHTANHWPRVVERMQMRMSSKAQRPLKPKEFSVLLDYLQRHGAAVEPEKAH
jgi:cytochrome c5